MSDVLNRLFEEISTRATTSQVLADRVAQLEQEINDLGEFVEGVFIDLIDEDRQEANDQDLRHAALTLAASNADAGTSAATLIRDAEVFFDFIKGVK